MAGLRAGANTHTVESCYEKAGEFIPERWTSKPELVKNKAAFAPFSLGRSHESFPMVLANLVRLCRILFMRGKTGSTDGTPHDNSASRNRV